MYRLKRALRVVGRVLFVVLVALTASLAPVAALPMMYIAQAWREKEVAVQVDLTRR